jgi:hypothetical protein
MNKVPAMHKNVAAKKPVWFLKIVLVCLFPAKKSVAA